MELIKDGANRWRIKRHGDMRTDGVLVASREILDGVRHDPALEQVVNVACLPGIVGPSLAMPDIHWGYGFPIGGVAAFDADDGVVSPGGVGYDINCGVRILATGLQRVELEDVRQRIGQAIYRSVPTGVGSSRGVKLNRKDLARVCEEGAGWLLRRGQASEADLDHIEDRGCIPGADADALSDRALERGRDQLGTLGSGNHFVELAEVEQIRHPDAAAAMGLEQGGVVVTIHTGSRGLGHQVCTDTVNLMGRSLGKHGISLPDRQLVCAPIGSNQGRRYLAAMNAAANFAFANRQLITHHVVEAMERVLGMGPDRHRVRLIYDLAHNIAKMESHDFEGRTRRLLVHRKGATRALPAGHPLVPDAWRSLGQPVLIPGDMGRASFVAVGAPGALEHTFGSCAHGAGRVMSRKQAMKVTRGRSVSRDLAEQGVLTWAASSKTLREEVPEAYKDVNMVMDAVEGAGIARAVARLKPFLVVKG